MYKPSSLPYIVLSIVFLIIAISVTPSNHESKEPVHSSGTVFDEFVTNSKAEETKRPVHSEYVEYTKEPEAEAPETEVLDYPIVEYGSDGIEYSFNADRTAVIVTGIGSCTDTYITIPSVYMGYRVLEIDANAFQGNKNIVSVTIADGVTVIGENAFNGCGKLVEVSLPAYTLKTISASAFANCISLTKINIPASVSYIGELTFSRCKQLFDLNYEGTSSQWITIEKHPNWSNSSYLTAVYCTDTSLYIS